MVRIIMELIRKLFPNKDILPLLTELVRKLFQNKDVLPLLTATVSKTNSLGCQRNTVSLNSIKTYSFLTSIGIIYFPL